jgi:hypothetical protein
VGVLLIRVRGARIYLFYLADSGQGTSGFYRCCFLVGQQFNSLVVTGGKIMRQLLQGLMAVSFVLMLAALAQADATGGLITGVPDWNQPNDYGPPPPPGGYPGWCAPTAGANIMGYWEDQKGCVGLTDRQAFANSPAYAGMAGTWQQGLYHDGMIEMGWFMNTGGWNQQNPLQSAPFAGGTNLNMIGIGLLAYANDAHADPTSGLVKVAYQNAVSFMEDTNTPLATMWATYTNQINVGHPVEASFDQWVDTANYLGLITVPGTGVDAEKYAWKTSEAHSVVGVGYIDLTPGFNGDEWFVCQDGWPAQGVVHPFRTGQYVAVPVDGHWMQNDYIVVPEPSMIVLLMTGGISLMIYGWRRRKTV